MFTCIYFSSGGVLITATGQDLNSVAEPVMVVTVILDGDIEVYFQVKTFSQKKTQ